MIKIGLTGSIAMGKTETAKLFSKKGIRVFDADKVVSDLYKSDNNLINKIKEVFPDAIVNSIVDKDILSKIVLSDVQKMTILENIVHPFVDNAWYLFVAEAENNGDNIVIFDIPLLFETGKENIFDKIIVVSAPKEIQKSRAMSRKGMTEEKFNSIVKLQVPDEIKRNNADFIIMTNKGIESAEQQVKNILYQLDFF